METKAIADSVINSTPYLAGLKTAVLPIRMAGNSTQKVSLSG